MLYALIFSALFLLHAPWLRLPYFWDEAGYYIPAARDLLLTGDLIPHSTLSNAHPPLLMIWLAAWWKLSAYSAAVTRTAMLLVSAFALLGVFTLARRVANLQVAAATMLLTALFPVFFAQSSLAHLDMMAAAFTLWGLAAYVPLQASVRSPCSISDLRFPISDLQADAKNQKSEIRNQKLNSSVLWFALAGLAKETAMVAPMAICAWELIRPSIASVQPDDTHICQYRADVGHLPTLSGRRRGAAMLLAFLPLVAWLVYHFARTGFFFGNPEYFRYNVGATLTPLRFALALIERLWQAFGYLNLFVLTGAAALAMRNPPLVDAVDKGQERSRISLPVQGVFLSVIAAYLLMLAAVGGAVLARYLLPVYPLVILLCVSTLRRRISWWPWIVVLSAATFISALFLQPLYRIAPEDNLTYVDFVKAHKQTADFLVEHYPEARILTSWPATDELTRPWLGYVKQPMPVVRIDNFTGAQLRGAAKDSANFDTALLFSTKYEPATDVAAPLLWWRKMQEKYFDYHRDLPPEVAAALLGGRLVYQARRGAEWAAVVRIESQQGERPLMHADAR